MCWCGTCPPHEWDRPKHWLPPWCGLCQNDVWECDGLVILVIRQNSDGIIEVLKTLSGYKNEFPSICLASDSKDEVNMIKLHDSSYTRSRVVCHGECLEAIAPSRIPEVLQRAAYTFVPSKVVRKRRENWLISKTAQVVSTSVKWLPPEVSVNIARECSSALALSHAESLAESVASLAARRKPMSMAMVKYPMWARYVMFDGVAYVAELSNLRFPKGVTAVPVSRTSKIDTLYVAQDHLGIRRVMLGNSEDAPQVSPEPGLWWWASSFQQPGQLHSHSDGIKLRKLSTVSNGITEEVKPEHMWAIPQPLKKRLRIHKGGYCYRIPRFTFFEINHPDVIGYSACWYKTVRVIHPHFAGEDITFYKETAAEHPTVTWLYMPMDKGELVTELWESKVEIHGVGRPESRRIQSLVMKTSQGRMWNIGLHSRRHHGVWTLLDTPSASPSRIYIEDTLTELPQLAFESPEPNKANRPWVPYRSSIEHYQLLNGDFDEEYWDKDLDEDYIYSSAALCGVSKLSFCRGDADGIPNCILGILLHYRDGCRRVVGSVRPDLLDPFVEVGDSRGMSFRMNKWKNVVEVTLSTVDEVDGWIKVPWFGTLVWWFSSYRCEISHEGGDDDL
ncbi:hypothetical protein CDV36_012681 [Fusarium kuroshium]|uniref:Uncharacterized protein n=3 Tax=Fusarium solani species complex TaxID=232080 RepID=A0A3M2RR22_9HYPO|nr:hypothetical protein CDV36_012681 [Fusarium kuroshium]